MGNNEKFIIKLNEKLKEAENFSSIASIVYEVNSRTEFVKSVDPEYLTDRRGYLLEIILIGEESNFDKICELVNEVIPLSRTITFDYPSPSCANQRIIWRWNFQGGVSHEDA